MRAPARRPRPFARGPATRRLGIVLVAALVLAIAPGVADAQDRIEGTWEMQPADRVDGRVHLVLRVDTDRGDWRIGFDVERDELDGMSEDSAGDLDLELVREAGTLRLEGRGASSERRRYGTFHFTADPRYRRRLTELGYGSVPLERLLLFAVEEVSIAYVEGLRDLGYDRLSDDDLVRFVIHDVTLEYVRALAELGYDDVGSEQLVRLRIHDVTPEYVRDVRRALGRQ